MKYSVIIPVYNRPDEVDELLESLTHQTVKDFEVVVVEDGSTVPCKEVVEKYTDKLDIPVGLLKDELSAKADISKENLRSEHKGIE